MITIVATAGMASTTYVQFLKGGLLIIFSTIVTILVVRNGLLLNPSEEYHDFQAISATVEGGEVVEIASDDYSVAGQYEADGVDFVKLEQDGVFTWWSLGEIDGQDEVLQLHRIGLGVMVQVREGGERMHGQRDQVGDDRVALVPVKGPGVPVVDLRYQQPVRGHDQSGCGL